MAPVHPSAVGPGGQLLSPEVLARIADLELLAKTVVEGFLSGLHRSIYLGLSLDFAEHRPYMPGDDIRRIDWRLFGRTDRHYIKLFEADTNANFVALVDVSSSMGYGTGAVSKLDYARYLAACLAYFSRRQRDRVGLVTFAKDVVEYIPPSARHLDLCLHALHRASTKGAGGLAAPLSKAAETLRRRGIVVLVSDLYERSEEVLRAVRGLRASGQDVMVFHVLDPGELDFPFQGAANFRDMETGSILPILPEKIRERYRAVFRGHLDRLQEGFAASKVDYLLLDISRPLDIALFRYLLHRLQQQKRGRVR